MSLACIAINTFEHFQEKIIMTYRIYSLDSKMFQAFVSSSIRYIQISFCMFLCIITRRNDESRSDF
jgi:hypothetical protein